MKVKTLIREAMKRMERIMKRGQRTVTQGQVIRSSNLRRILTAKIVSVSLIMYQNYRSRVTKCRIDYHVRIVVEDEADFYSLVKQPHY